MIRRLLAVAALALLGAGVAATASAGPAPLLPAEDSSSVGLTLSAFGPSVLTSEAVFTTTAMVSNPTSFAITDLSVSLSVTRDPIASQVALRAFLQDPSVLPVQQTVSAPITSSAFTMYGGENVLPPGSTVPVNLRAGAAALGLPSDTSGVYGLVVEVRGATGVITSHTAAITWYDAPLPTLRLAFVATASGSAERVAEVTSAASVDGVAVAIDPVTITEPLQGTTLVNRNEMFSLPSGDVDLTSLAHAQNEALVNFSLEDAATNALPVLTGWPWLATIPVVDQPTIELAASHGAVAGILDTTGGAALAGAEAPVVDVTAGDTTLPVLVPNAGLSNVAATYRPGSVDSAARLVAEAALVAQLSDGVTPVVVSPGAAWQINSSGSSTPVAELLSAPWVVPVTLESVINGPDRDAATAPTIRGPGADLEPELIATLDRRLAELAQLAVTVNDADDVYLPGGRTLLAPLAVGLRADSEARATTFDEATAQVDATLGALQVAVGSDVNLIAASGNVPVTLHNDLPVDATVTLVMRSTSPNLVVHDQPVVTIPAGGDMTALVAVSGVKSANVIATVALENADGDVVSPPQVMRVRVRADWGNAVTAALTVGLVVLLVAGLIRTVRRGRRSSRMAPVPAAPKEAKATGSDKATPTEGGDDG